MWGSTIGCIVTLMLSLLIAPLTAEAQPTAKVPRIGVLANNSLASVLVQYIEPFRQGLRDLGYVEGQNIVVEYRFAEWQEDQLPALTAELLQFPVEVLVTLAAPATRVARQATTTIPIVFMIVNDPVGQGFVASLAQPGGNVTGVSTLSSDLSGKRLELLQEAVPGLRRVALLWNAANPGMALQFHEAQAAAQGLGLDLLSVEVRGPDECDRALAAALEAHAEGLVVLAGTPVRSRTQIVDFAAAHQLPAIYAESEIVKAGGLMSYGPHPVTKRNTRRLSRSSSKRPSTRAGAGDSAYVLRSVRRRRRCLLPEHGGQAPPRGPQVGRRLAGSAPCALEQRDQSESCPACSHVIARPGERVGQERPRLALARGVLSAGQILGARRMVAADQERRVRKGPRELRIAALRAGGPRACPGRCLGALAHAAPGHTIGPPWATGELRHLLQAHETEARAHARDRLEQGQRVSRRRLGRSDHGQLQGPPQLVSIVDEGEGDRHTVWARGHVVRPVSRRPRRQPRRPLAHEMPAAPQQVAACPHGRALSILACPPWSACIERA